MFGQTETQAAIRPLAEKYAVPARMWWHGIHSVLEFVRHKFPVPLEGMLTFIYFAYSMMALLYETVPAPEATWIVRRADLGRYRMAMHEDGIRDLELLAPTSQGWYSQAIYETTTGRLYHDLAIFARPYANQQSYNYSRSVCAIIPSSSAYDGIPMYFNTFSKIIVAAPSFSPPQLMLSLSPPGGIGASLLSTGPPTTKAHAPTLGTNSLEGDKYLAQLTDQPRLTCHLTRRTGIATMKPDATYDSASYVRVRFTGEETTSQSDSTDRTARGPLGKVDTYTPANHETRHRDWPKQYRERNDPRNTVFFVKRGDFCAGQSITHSGPNKQHIELPKSMFDTTDYLGKWICDCIDDRHHSHPSIANLDDDFWPFQY